MCSMTESRVLAQNADLAWVTIIIDKIPAVGRTDQSSGKRGMRKINSGIQNRDDNRLAVIDA